MAALLTIMSCSTFKKSDTIATAAATAAAAATSAAAAAATAATEATTAAVATMAIAAGFTADRQRNDDDSKRVLQEIIREVRQSRVFVS